MCTPRSVLEPNLIDHYEPLPTTVGTDTRLGEEYKKKIGVFKENGGFCRKPIRGVWSVVAAPKRKNKHRAVGDIRRIIKIKKKPC